MACSPQFLDKETVIGIATVLAEFFVGLVIYSELNHSRTGGFLEKATEEEADEDRRVIYRVFLSLSDYPTLDERSAEFTRRMLADSTAVSTREDPNLKVRCDRQIALFNDLGITTIRWYRGGGPLVEVFPHAAIYMWIILRPYIIARRMDAGLWFARPLIRFTLRSVQFVLKENRDRGLHLRHGDGTEGITIDRNYLLKIQSELADLADCPFYIMLNT